MSIAFQKFCARHKKRFLLLTLAFAVASICGYYMFTFIYDYVLSKYLENFNALSLHTFGALAVGLDSNYQVSQALSEVFTLHCPTMSNWPNCRYVKIVSPLVKMGLLRDIALVPIVKTSSQNVIKFEAFAYNFYKSNSFYKAGSSNVSSYSNEIFNGGIFSITPGTSERYRDTSGSTSFSKHNILTPVLEVFEQSSISSVLYNLHSEYNRGKAVDQVIDAWDAKVRNSSAVTSMLQLVQESNQRPASMLFYPIAPESDDDELVGFIRAVHDWDTVLSEAVPANAENMQIVISDGIQLATFLVATESVTFIGWGDFHDSTYDRYRKTYTPNNSKTGYMRYSFSIYPTAEFFPQDVMAVSIVSCIAVVVFVLLFTSAILVHDIHLQGKLQQQQEMLTLKQKFVRFISHEIRTPMNAVCIGLKLLMDEVEHSLTYLQCEMALRGIGHNDDAGSVTQSEAELASTEAEPPASVVGESKRDSDTMQLKGGINLCTDIVVKLTSWSQLLKEVEESSNRSVSILNELLSYDEIQQKTMSIQREFLQVWDIISSAVSPFSIQARERNVELSIQLEPNAVHSDASDPLESDSHQKQLKQLLIIGDSVRLTQVFRSIVSNAVKFSDPGSQVWINAVWCPKNLLKEGAAMIASIDPAKRSKYAARGSLKVTVKDCGPGLTPRNLKRLFGEGVQFNTDKLQAGGGSGLGLWITKGIVDLHSGTIIATSLGLGHGCTFTMELPVVVQRIQNLRGSITFDDIEMANEDHPADQPTVAPIAPAVAPALLRSSFSMPVVDWHGDTANNGSTHNRTVTNTLYTVLVVDDSSPSRKMLSRVLKNFGCTCFEAEDGDDCVRMYSDRVDSGDVTYDLVLMDFVMPKMNGPEATAELRKAGYRGLVVGVTGNVLQDDIDHFMRSGADAVLSKPLSIPKLKETLKTLNCGVLGNTVLNGRE